MPEAKAGDNGVVWCGKPDCRILVQSAGWGAWGLMSRAHWYILYFFLVSALAFESTMYLASEESLGSASLVYTYILLVSLLILCLVFIVGKTFRRLSHLLICIFLALSIFLLK
ncbi:MAG: hypothetical protein ACR2QW_00850, partial [bacterium]